MLQPLTYGNVLIVGVKSSNFNDEIRTHPRVTIWDSQQEHWTNKDVPSNVRAIFVTRFIGHAAFKRIHTEAKKKRLTIFNPEGTGMIVRQVKELLDMNRIEEPLDMNDVVPDYIKATEVKGARMTQTEAASNTRRKLYVLKPFIDFNKGNIENARYLMTKLSEFGITSTINSLANFVDRQRDGNKSPLSRNTHNLKVHRTTQAHSKTDVSVEILDNMIKELQDMRDYLVAVTAENEKLKTLIAKFRKFFEA